MKPIDNWADAARRLHEDTRNLTKALKDMNARITALEAALEAAVDTGWAFKVGDRVTDESGRAMYGEDAPVYKITDRRRVDSIRVYELDGWMSLSDGFVEEQGWEKI